MAFNVALDTTLGTIVVELYTQHAPKTCRNFATLAAQGYYDDTIFHRVVHDFVAQAGDPTGTGRGGHAIYPGGRFEDELHEGLRHAGAGVLSMANAGPNTNGSQFFLTLSPTPWLDGRHTIFGRVKSGMPVLKRIGSVETDDEDRPVQEVRIIQARTFQGDDGSKAPISERAHQDKRRSKVAAAQPEGEEQVEEQQKQGQQQQQSGHHGAKRESKPDAEDKDGGDGDGDTIKDEARYKAKSNNAKPKVRNDIRHGSRV